MKKVVKRPAASKKEEREWLERYERGESPPQIAKFVDRDVRLIRKHIKLAAQERAVSEAQTLVFRKALEDHYRDFNRFLKDVDGEVEKGKSISNLTTRAEWKALRQHIPSSKIWTGVREYEDSLESVNTATKSLERWIKSEAGGMDVRGLQPGEGIVAEGVADRLKTQARLRLLGGDDLEFDQPISYEPASKPGYSHLKQGPSVVGIVRREADHPVRQSPEEIPSESSTAGIMASIKKLRTKLHTSQEYKNLADRAEHLNKVKEFLHEGLETLIMKRVVGGHCKYCPF